MRFSVFLLFMLLQHASFAQSSSTFERAGDKSMAKGNFYEAMLYFQSALAKRDDSGLYAKIGQAAFESHSFNIAEKYLSKIVNDKKLSRKYPDVAYYLAETYRYLGNYNAAKSVFSEYQAGASTNSALRQKAQLAQADLGNIEQLPKDTSLKINKLDKVNSEYSDFAPMQIGDTLYYSSMRFPLANDAHQPPRVFAKIMYSKSMEKGKVVNFLDPKDSTHVAHLSFNAPHTRMVFTKCIYLNDNVIQCKLYERKLDANGKWSKPELLPEPINQQGYTSTHPQLSFDSVSQKEMLYFVSDCPGGSGKMDIWSSEIKSKAYARPVNLTAVNTPDNEVSPYYDATKNLLYFSSQGRGGLGGYDIFKYQSGSRKVENLGTPYNSSFDDLYFITTNRKTDVFFASNRPGSQYLDKNNQTCCYDIYQGKLNPSVEKVAPPLPKTDSLPLLAAAPKIETPVAQKSLPKTETTLPKNTTAEPKPVVDKTTPIKSTALPEVPAKQPIVQKAVTPETSKTTPDVVAKSAPPVTKKPSNSIVTSAEKLSTLLPIVLFYDNDEPDKRTTATNTLKNYNDTYYYYHQKKAVFKQEYAAGGKQNSEMLDQLDDFFENEVEVGMFKLNQFSEAVYKKLVQGVDVEVFIKGFTSPRATSAYNLSLAQRRIHCVKNHFRTWKYGALQQYLNSGALKISEKPLGETQAPGDVSDDLEDLPASVYDVRASRERRVELVEVREN